MAPRVAKLLAGGARSSSNWKKFLFCAYRPIENNPFLIGPFLYYYKARSNDELCNAFINRNLYLALYKAKVLQEGGYEYEAKTSYELHDHAEGWARHRMK